MRTRWICVWYESCGGVDVNFYDWDTEIKSCVECLYLDRLCHAPKRHTFKYFPNCFIPEAKTEKNHGYSR